MKQKKSWWILVIVSLGVIVPFMAPYLTFDIENSRITIRPGSLQYIALVTHIILAFIALITGFLQFIEKLRLKKPNVHRNLGKVYVISIFLSGLVSVILVFYIEDFTKSVSFLTLTILWLFTTWKGFNNALKGKIAEHRIWMVRSFAMTLVAVSGRLLVPILLLAYYTLNGYSLPGGRDMMIKEVLNVNIWVGIIVNFVIVEWIILKKKK